jgi:hypothetical protein
VDFNRIEVEYVDLANPEEGKILDHLIPYRASANDGSLQASNAVQREPID